MSANYESRGDVAVITLDNPPVNGLGYDTRRGILDGLGRALADDKVKAIVVTGAGKSFSGGADIREFGSSKAGAEPNLLSVIAALEASPKPIVAAVNGVAMGGGLELSLGCHYRVAVKGAPIALPEVKIGLIPGAGGTQRLPRVLGVETALNMIVSGEPVKSEMLAALPGQKLFDRIVDGDVVDAAVAMAREKADVRPLPVVSQLKVSYPNADAYFQFARNTVGAMSRNFPAPLKCVDAVAASTKMKFADGMKLEREIFTALMLTPESKALRHAFVAERATTKIPDVPADTPVRAIKKVAVIGAGTMGGGIAMNFLNAGIPVVMIEMKQDALDKGVGIMRKNYEAQVKKGKLKQEKLDERMALLSTTLKYDDLKDADLVIEAVFEDLKVKEQVFKTLDEVMKPGAILASNTSTLDLDKIAAFTKRPEDVIGMHFFSPANVMKLLEVVRGKKTAKDVLATVMQLGKKIKKTTVVSGVTDGFIGNRMIEQYSRQAGFPAGRGRDARAGRQGDGEVRHGDGPVPDGRPGRQRRRLVHPEAPLRREARHPLLEDRRPAVRARPLRPEDGRRLVRLRAGQARREAEQGRHRHDRDAPRRARHHGEQDRRRGDRASPRLRARQRGREDRRRRDRDARERRRHGLPHRLRLPAVPRRADELRGPARALQCRRVDEALRREPEGRPELLAAGAAAREARERRQVASAEPRRTHPHPRPSPALPQAGEGARRNLMTSAVIVSTARTPLAKSWKGAFNMTHGATLGGFAVKAAVERAGIDPAEVDDVIMGCATPEGATGSNIARQIALRAGLPITTSGMTINRFCSSGLQTIATAAQRIIAGENDVVVAGGVESISCVQNEANKHMLADPWLVEHKPEIYWNMLQTAEQVAKRYKIDRERMDRYGAESQQKATAARDAGRFDAEIVAVTTLAGVADAQLGLRTKEVTISADEGIRPARPTKASRTSSRRSPAA